MFFIFFLFSFFRKKKSSFNIHIDLKSLTRKENKNQYTSMTNFLENGYIINSNTNGMDNIMRIESLLCQSITDSESMVVNFEYNPHALLCAPTNYLEFDSSESSLQSQECLNAGSSWHTPKGERKKPVRKRRTPKVSPEPSNNDCASPRFRFVNYAQHHWAPQPPSPSLPLSLNHQVEEDKSQVRDEETICTGEDTDAVCQNGFWAEAFLRECGIVYEDSAISACNSAVSMNEYDSEFEEVQVANLGDKKSEMVRSSAPSPEPVSFRFKQYSGVEMEKVVRMTKERARKKNKGPSPWRVVNKEIRNCGSGVSKTLRKKQS